MTKGSTAFVVANNKILLFHRDDKQTIPDPDCWDVIGGHADPEETPEQTVVREIKEEISVEINDPELLSTFTDVWNAETHLYVVKLSVEQADQVKLGEGEGQEIKFFSLNELSNIKLTQNMKRYLVDYKEQLEKLLTVEDV